MNITKRLKMNKNKRLIMISISLLILAYILGMLTVKKRLFPYPQIVNILKNNKIDEPLADYQK